MNLWSFVSLLINGSVTFNASSISNSSMLSSFSTELASDGSRLQI